MPGRHPGALAPEGEGFRLEQILSRGNYVRHPLSVGLGCQRYRDFIRPRSVVEDIQSRSRASSIGAGAQKPPPES
jgi:hypothetical protein